LKEVADRNTWLAIIFGFLGVVVAVQFSQLSGHTFSLPGVLATMLASLTLALSMLTARGAGSENNYALSFWPQLVCCALSTIIVFMVGNIVLNTTGIVYAMVSGVMGSLGLVLTNASLRVAPVAVVSPYHYIQIIGAAIAGYLIWHSLPSASVIVGAVMIIGSGLYILHHENRRAKRNSNESVSTLKQTKDQGDQMFCQSRAELQDEIV
jgi:drug/metabolite transporter (DMT)-like permease